MNLFCCPLFSMEKTLQDKIEETLYGPNRTWEVGNSKIIIFNNQWQLFGGKLLEDIVLENDEYAYILIDHFLNNRLTFGKDSDINNLYILYKFVVDNSLDPEDKCIKDYISILQRYSLQKIYESAMRSMISVLIMYFDSIFVDKEKIIHNTNIMLDENIQEVRKEHYMENITVIKGRSISSLELSRKMIEARKEISNKPLHNKIFPHKNMWKYLVKDSLLWNPKENVFIDEIPELFGMFLNSDHYPNLTDLSYNARINLMYEMRDFL